MLPSVVASLRVTTDQHVPEDWSVQEQGVSNICCVLSILKDSERLYTHILCITQS